MHDDPTFAVRRSFGRDGPYLALIGELDAYTAPKLRRAIVDELATDGSGLVLDCARLAFVDGGGMKVIEWAALAFAPRPVEVRDAAPTMVHLAEITGVDRWVEFRRSTTEHPAARPSYTCERHMTRR